MHFVFAWYIMNAKWGIVAVSEPFAHKMQQKSHDLRKGGRKMDVYGEYHHSIDTKKRLFIPAKFREELCSTSDTFYITRKLEKALIIYSAEGWADLKRKLNEKPDSVVGKIKQFIFPKTVDATPDANGRVILSPFLIEYAGLGKDVVVAGVGDHVEIWSEEAWNEKEASMDTEELTGILKELGL